MVTLAGFPFAKRLGELIQGATLTANEVLEELIADGADIFVALKAIQELHDLSVLNDDPSSKGSKFREYRLAAV